MSELRALLEREMTDLELRPFTLDEFHRRRRRTERTRRVSATVMGLVLAIAVVGGVFRTVAVDSAQKVATANGEGAVVEPPSPFAGTWASTDVDGSSQTMDIRAVGPNTFDVVMHDDAATQACAGAPATLTGTGEVDADGTFVVVADIACDDGSAPTPLADPESAAELEALLARIELRLDTLTGELVGLDVRWRRPAAEEHVPGRSGPESG